MILNSPTEPHFRGLYARVGAEYGVTADEVRNTLLALCDTMRQGDERFPETPEELLLSVFAVSDTEKTVSP